MKTPKVRKREVSIHSRAAKRGASPTRKDPAVKAPVEETDYKPWLHAAENAGISKKRKSKQLTRQQKLRQERALELAERNMDRHEKKVEKSKTRGKKIQARRTEWEELNEKIVGKENGDSKSKEVAKMDSSKRMEGVVMPDLDQPLPIRTVDEAPAEINNGNETAAVPG